MHADLRTLSKYLIIAVTLASAATIVYGFNVVDDDPIRGHRLIGGGTAGLFLLAMPLFLIRESRHKKMKDYMLTRENIEKMRDKDRNAPENGNKDEDLGRS